MSSEALAFEIPAADSVAITICKANILAHSETSRFCEVCCLGNLCEPEERCFLHGDSMEDAALFSRWLSGMPKSRKREHVSVFSVRVMQPIQA